MSIEYDQPNLQPQANHKPTTSQHSNKNKKENKNKSQGDFKNEMTPEQKRNYAIAMENEREQKKRSEVAKARDGTGLEKAKAIAEKIRLRKVTI